MKGKMALELRGMAPLLQVYDMPTSIRFYRDALGFEIVNTSPVMGVDYFHWALLRRNDVEIMLNTAYEFEHERPERPEISRVTHHRDTSLFFGCPDVDGAYAYLHAKGIPLKKPEDARYGMRQMYLRDPDGYSLCFQWPTKPA
jgi:glyoxylase I family protein